MGKQTICICEHKGADQRLCFRYTDSTIPLLSKSKILLVFPRGGSNNEKKISVYCIMSRMNEKLHLHGANFETN